jgi:hypothetical protein
MRGIRIVCGQNELYVSLNLNHVKTEVGPDTAEVPHAKVPTLLTAQIKLKSLLLILVWMQKSRVFYASTYFRKIQNAAALEKVDHCLSPCSCLQGYQTYHAPVNVSFHPNRNYHNTHAYFARVINLPVHTCTSQLEMQTADCPAFHSKALAAGRRV